jgi:hypothetical protein
MRKREIGTPPTVHFRDVLALKYNAAKPTGRRGRSTHSTYLRKIQ